MASWPARSPDLIPIEYLFDELRCRLAKTRRALHEEWSSAGVKAHGEYTPINLALYPLKEETYAFLCISGCFQPILSGVVGKN